MAAAATPQLIVNALISRCRAQRDEALAELSILINTSVGVGEHPDIAIDGVQQRSLRRYIAHQLLFR